MTSPKQMSNMSNINFLIGCSIGTMLVICFYVGILIAKELKN